MSANEFDDMRLAFDAKLIVNFGFSSYSVPQDVRMLTAHLNSRKHIWAALL
jgi:hypothetical protein